MILICGKWFGWLEFNFEGITMMVISVSVVHLLVWGAYYLIDLRQANKINQRLLEKYGDDRK